MHAIGTSAPAVARSASTRRAAALAIGLALSFFLALPAAAEPPQFEVAQEVLAQRPDGTWQRAMIDGKFDGKGYPVQFMEPPYGNEVLPPERIRIDPEKGTLAEQLARAFPEIPKWTGLLVVRKKDGLAHWAHLTAQHGSILKIAWDDGAGRQKIAHKDILEQRTPTPGQIAAAELARERALRRLERRCDRQLGRPARDDLSIGYHVKALDRDDGQWYWAKILWKSGDAYQIAWEDGVDSDEYRSGCELVSP